MLPPEELELDNNDLVYHGTRVNFGTYTAPFYVNIFSFDHSININIFCRRTDFFFKIKEKLYQKHPELKYKNLSFMHYRYGSIIKEFATIGENNLDEDDKIIIIEKE